MKGELNRQAAEDAKVLADGICLRPSVAGCGALEETAEFWTGLTGATGFCSGRATRPTMNFDELRRYSMNYDDFAKNKKIRNGRVDGNLESEAGILTGRQWLKSDQIRANQTSFRFDPVRPSSTTFFHHETGKKREKPNES
jgi:hypothetical protein